MTELFNVMVGAVAFVGSFLLLYWGWRTLLKRRQWRGHGVWWWVGMLLLASSLLLGLYACVAGTARYG